LKTGQDGFGYREVSVMASIDARPAAWVASIWPKPSPYPIFAGEFGSLHGMARTETNRKDLRLHRGLGRYRVGLGYDFAGRIRSGALSGSISKTRGSFHMNYQIHERSALVGLLVIHVLVGVDGIH